MLNLYCDFTFLQSEKWGFLAYAILNLKGENNCIPNIVRWKSKFIIMGTVNWICKSLHGTIWVPNTIREHRVCAMQKMNIPLIGATCATILKIGHNVSATYHI